MKSLFKKLTVIIGILAITTVAFSAINWVQYSYFKNSSGLNNAFSPIAIEDNEASDLQNVIFTTSGSFKKRSGFNDINDYRFGATTGIKYVKFSDGVQKLFGTFDNDKIYKMDYSSGPDGTWDDITGSLSFAITQNNLATINVGEDIVVIEDGLNTTPPMSYHYEAVALTCITLPGSPPNATVFAYHKNQGFCAGNYAAPSTLYFTDVGDLENWTTGLAGNVNVENNDGSIIRALVPGFDALYIFKDNSIFRLTGDDKDNFELQRMVQGIGVMSPQAISLIGNQFFLTTGQGEVYIYDGAVGVTKISNKIEGSLKINTSYSRYPYLSTLEYLDDYYLSVSSSGSGTNDIVFMFDTFNMAWTKFDGINSNAWTVFDDGTGKDKILFGDYHGTVCQYPESDNDNGSAIDAYYTTKQFNYPELGPDKDWRTLRVYSAQEATDYNLTVTTYKDFETTGTENSINLKSTTGGSYGTAVYGVDVYGGESINVNRIEVNLDADFYKVKFSNSNADQPFEVFGFQMFVEKTEGNI